MPAERGVTAAPPRLIVGITGASGTVYGVRLLRALQGSGIETHLVLSDAARITMAPLRVTCSIDCR